MHGHEERNHISRAAKLRCTIECSPYPGTGDHGEPRMSCAEEVMCYVSSVVNTNVELHLMDDDQI